MKKLFHVVHGNRKTNSRRCHHCIYSNNLPIQVYQRSTRIANLSKQTYQYCCVLLLLEIISWKPNLPGFYPMPCLLLTPFLVFVLLHACYTVVYQHTFMIASVWMYSMSRLSSSRSPSSFPARHKLLTIPAVTVLLRASGLPIATTHSPGRRSWTVPNGRLGRLV